MRSQQSAAHRAAVEERAGLPRRLRRGCGRLFLLLFVLACCGVAFAYWRATPEALPSGSESEARVSSGPFVVQTSEFSWVDEARSTQANGEFEGAAHRAFDVTLWYPVNSSEPHPLVVYVHGFMAVRTGGAFLAEHLASNGYVVLAADHPLTHLGAPGGPNFDDVVNQPGDVSFLIDQALALRGAEKPFPGELDSERIGVMGLSLGGLTATLAAFHPQTRDERLAAAISIAGPADIFAAEFFDHAEVPFLMIGGTGDAMVEYESNAAVIPDRITSGGLITLEGATHLGFDQVATTWFRPFANPDRVACRIAAAAGQEAEEEHPFSGMLGTPEQGVMTVDEVSVPCSVQVPEPMKAVRQHLLTRMIVRAFFDSYFAADAAQRRGHREFLEEVLPREVPQVRFTAPRRAAPSRSSSSSVDTMAEEAAL